MSGVACAIARTLLDPTVSLKRIAWAYGCSPKGSDEERCLEQLLRARVVAEQGAGVVAEQGAGAS